MGWFGGRKAERKNTGAGVEAAIAEFWRWWAQAAPSLEAAISNGTLGEQAGQINAQVTAIDPNLAWEFGPGHSSQHHFTVSAGGDPALRRVARRWLLAAPAADAIWTFYDMRQPGPLDSVLSFADAELVLADVRVAGQQRGSGLDVLLHHPLFANLPEATQAQISYLCLDNALGEQTVELWIGAVEYSGTDPGGTVPLSELPGIVAEVIAEGMPDGEMGWTVLEGDGPRGPVTILCQSRLSSVQAPDLDQHIAVEVPYRDQTPNGWPGPGSLDALRGFEEHLEAIVGASGRVVAVESCAGVRTMHFYVDSTSPALAQLQAASGGWKQGRVKFNSEYDPGWSAVQQFRT